MRAAVAGKHKGWRQGWQVNLAAHTATHESGLVVHFGTPPTDAVLFHRGSVMPDNLVAVMGALEKKNGAHNAPIMLQRLGKESCEAWSEALRRASQQQQGEADRALDC